MRVLILLALITVTGCAASSVKLSRPVQGPVTVPIVAQAPSKACGSRAEVVHKLKQGYSERPVSMGLNTSGHVVEVFASKAGTFTIVLTFPNGTSCLISVGENWQNIPTDEGQRL